MIFGEVEVACVDVQATRDVIGTKPNARKDRDCHQTALHNSVVLVIDRKGQYCESESL